jgi:hypothetical protein
MGMDIQHLRGAVDEAAPARVSHGNIAVSESGELAPNTPGPGSLRPKAKLIGFISKMIITLRMRSLGCIRIRG